MSAHVTKNPEGVNGPAILLEENHDLPLCRVQLTVRTGAATDPATKEDFRPGLCNFATELMRRGAGGRTRAQLDEALDNIGASIYVGCGRDSVTFEVLAIRNKLDEALGILGDVVLRPDWLENEAEKLRRELCAHLDDLRDDDNALCWRFFQRALYGDHPLGRPVSGTGESIPRLDVDGSRDWYSRFLVRSNLILGAAGDLREDELLRIWERHFGGVPAGPRRDAPTEEPPGWPDYPGQRLCLVDKPERTQSQILMGQFAPRWAEPAWLPLRVAVTAFGGTFTARLMDEVRVKRGLSYGASARTGAGRGRPMLYVHVFPSAQQTPETLELVLRLYREWAEQGLQAGEVDFAKGYLARGFAFRIETPEARLSLRTELLLCGMAQDYIETFPQRVTAVTVDEVNEAMRAYLRPDGLLTTVVGTAETLAGPIAAVPALAGVPREVLSFDSY